MKSRKNRLFWTALGCRLLCEEDCFDTSELPEEMRIALESPVEMPEESHAFRGTDLEGRRGRHIYMYTWKILRDLGFSRPFRCEVFPRIELFLPFVRGRVAVLPQGFQKRIPLRLRAHALVGKTAALKALSIQLVIVAAIYEEATWRILKNGGCSVCTPDRLLDTLQALDLSQ